MAEDILAAFRDTINGGRPLIMAGVGSGLTAGGAVKGGADLLATYSTAVYRCRGMPSLLSFLPYDNANDLTFTVAPEVLANAGTCPVILGLGAHNPDQPIDALLDRAEALGAAGVMNEPFIGMYGQEIRAELDAAGCGFQREVELISRAAQRGLLTFAWAFSPEEARALSEAGACLIGAMLGPTRTDELALDQAIADADCIADAALEANPNVLVLAHGGPLASPPVVKAFLKHSRCHGYATGSSAERYPVTRAVSEAVAAFREPRQSG
ncbi:MAG: phosphoenolpyruvate hydrolase family protein [Hyphomicrobiales bacterium]|nr:phosphoenolpyruvate hydrolase family protein [Hyphomicrobiales bacterium]